MKIFILALFVFFTSHTSAIALSGEVEDCLEKLRKDIEIEPYSTNSTKATISETPHYASSMDRKKVAFSMIIRLRSSLNSGNFSDVQQIIPQIAMLASSDESHASLNKLQSLVETHKKQLYDQELLQIESCLQRTRQALKNAKRPEDLDPVLSELSKLQESSNHRTYRGETQKLPQLNQTYQFVVKWQDYLSAIVAGDLQAAKNALDYAANNSAADMLPRSEILLRNRELSAGAKNVSKPSLQQEPPTLLEAQTLLKNVKTLDDIAPCLKKLRDLQKQNNRLEEVSQLITSLQSLDKIYQEFKVGLPTTIDFGINNFNNSDYSAATIAPLKAQLLLLVLPRHLNAHPGVKPKIGEDIQTFLERIGGEAKQTGDYSLVMRIKELQRSLVRGGSHSGSDASGLSAYVSARNQETAGQYMLATIQYQKALNSGSDIVPANYIGERLAALQREHPKDFEDGMERFLNPPQSSIREMHTKFGTRGPTVTPQATVVVPSLQIPAPQPTVAPTSPVTIPNK